MSVQTADRNQLDSLISQLASAPAASVSIEKRVELCRECIDGVFAERHEWALQAVRAKGLPDDSPLLAEDLLSGPAVVLRQLQLTIQTLTAITKFGRPRLLLPFTRLRTVSWRYLCFRQEATSTA